MMENLISSLDQLIALHKRNEDMWVDFFESSKEKILRDPAFGCDYLITAWCGIGGYDDERIFKNDADEDLRKTLHPKIYNMAVEIRNDQNY